MLATVQFLLIVLLSVFLTTMLPLSRIQNTQNWKIAGNVCWALYTIPATIIALVLWYGSSLLSDAKSTKILITLGLITFTILIWSSIATYLATVFRIYTKITNKILFLIFISAVQIIPPALTFIAISSGYFNWINISFYTDLPN